MKKVILGLMLTAFFGLMACEEDETQLDRDIAAIEAYLAENNIDAQVHESGLRYEIIEQGTGENPELTSRITIQYEGRLMDNNAIFDATLGDNTSTFTLGSLILGWQEGLPLIQEGGEIKLYIPSTLGYGETGSPGSIPSNANLIFTVKLIEVQN